MDNKDESTLASQSQAAQPSEVDDVQRIAAYWEDQARRGCVDAFECAIKEAWQAGSAHLAGQSQATRARCIDLMHDLMRFECVLTPEGKAEMYASETGPYVWFDHVISMLAAPTAQEVTQQAAPTEAPIHPAIAKLKAECAEATRALKPYESPPEAPALQQAAKADPIGVVGTMPGTDGFTMACFKASEVPVGTKLYLAPTTSTVSAPEEVRNQAADTDFATLMNDYRYCRQDHAGIAYSFVKAHVDQNKAQAVNAALEQAARRVEADCIGFAHDDKQLNAIARDIRALRTTSGKGEA